MISSILSSLINGKKSQVCLIQRVQCRSVLLISVVFLKKPWFKFLVYWNQAGWSAQYLAGGCWRWHTVLISRCKILFWVTTWICLHAFLLKKQFFSYCTVFPLCLRRSVVAYIKPLKDRKTKQNKKYNKSPFSWMLQLRDKPNLKIHTILKI